jgi:CO/xanthine dehydrogenase Mo-binding subunit
MELDEVVDLHLKENKIDLGMNRRQFMKMTGGGIFLFFALGNAKTFAQEEGTGIRRSVPTDFNAFLRIGEDGRVTLYTGKIEMGQGVYTSLGQMLADELDVRLESVDMVMGDTKLCPWDWGTFGSMTTRAFGPSLRMAGAKARRVLVEMASEQLKVPEEKLTVEDGIIYEKNNRNNKVSYAELAKGKSIEREPMGLVTVKKPSEFKVIGKSFKRRDGEAKVTGQAKYAADFSVPGMVYARILRPPAHGSKLTDVDVSDAKKMDGIQVVQEGDFVAVLHKNPDVAEKALAKIKAKYDTPTIDVDDKSIFDHFLKVADDGRVVAHSGDLQTGEQGSNEVFDETYLNDYVAHAPMEPHTALVSVEDQKATVWASTQTPFTARDEVARELNMPIEDVRVITPFVGGGFGAKSRNQQMVEAARIARLSGKPVMLEWTRKEEFFNDTYRPAAVVKIKSGINANGKINLWDYKVYFAGDRGAEEFYDIPNNRTTVYNSGRNGEQVHYFGTGPWRAPANNTNTFARESQIDIMAAKAGKDPLEFRLQHLSDDKLKKVLKAAAEKFGWKSGKAPSGRGYGIDCGQDAGATVASMAEVEVDKSTGEIKVKRVVCAQDMGLIVNPEGAKIQIEGCITMGLGYTLTERIRFKGGEILDVNFDTYEIPRFSWLPKIETVLIEDQNSDPQGGGEPAIITMGGVVANAVYDAIGVRLFQLPMTPDRVLEAIKKS